jgi:hypothetical protein
LKCQRHEEHVFQMFDFQMCNVHKLESNRNRFNN